MWGTLLPILGGIFGGAAGGQSSGRQQQNNAINDANRNAIGLYGIQQGAASNTHQALQQALQQMLASEESSKLNRANLDLNQRQFALNAPSARGRQALTGSLLQNLQPVQFSGLSPQLAAKMPQISGGLSPSALGPMARQAGQLMQQNAVSGLQKGDQFDPIPQTDFRSGIVDPSKYIMPGPQMQQLKSPGFFEQLMSGMGLGSSLLGAILQSNAKNYDYSDQQYGG